MAFVTAFQYLTNHYLQLNAALEQLVAMECKLESKVNYFVERSRCAAETAVKQQLIISL
ncbi:hypothetical protein L2734_18320 [Parashewanella spongiae]|uniref:hypothetical protein n=1 Tax=Parashewanella spongiae TaxID=342950 RepID=UPI001404E47D|nr:hypothetical protein [Parashewanella spongiae]MCL1080085.1 hypothetical protein [Parashewanella spongiae]